MHICRGAHYTADCGCKPILSIRSGFMDGPWTYHGRTILEFGCHTFRALWAFLFCEDIDFALGAVRGFGTDSSASDSMAGHA